MDWSAPRTFDVDGAAIAAFVGGSGPAVLILSGFPESPHEAADCIARSFRQH